MSEVRCTGLFGKLPAHGDFIYRDLPSGFIEVWDQWLQGYVGSSQEQLGEAWLDIYLTSPIWRFALSEGVIDNKVWVGIMMPSVDRVGRYFPFSLATQLPNDTNACEFLCNRPNWFQAMEDGALRALDGEIGIDDLIEELNDSAPRLSDHYRRGGQPESASKMLVKLPSHDAQPATVLPQFFDAVLTQQLQSYSLWSTSGSEYLDACMFTSRGLPPFSGIAAMMDGRWNEWQWQEPFVLKSIG